MLSIWKTALFARSPRWLHGLLLLMVASRSYALEPDQIALVINHNIPASRQLAELYARTRAIPDGRIIELTLAAPNPANPLEDLAYADYEPKVAAPVRSFLRDHRLEQKVTCLVTFWGVPLRIDRKVNTPAENEEAEQIDRELKQVRTDIEQQAAALEGIARSIRSDYAPPKASTQQDPLLARIDAAMGASIGGLGGIQGVQRRAALMSQLIAIMEKLTGGLAAIERLATPGFAPLLSRPITPQQLASTREKESAVQARGKTADQRTREGREALRGLARENLGLLGLAQVLAAQRSGLESSETESALDSELALIWWGNYGRYRWQPNPLYWRAMAMHAPGPTLMVMRLDGPSEELVRGLIQTSAEVEAAGLQGRVALDARGKPPSDPYGAYPGLFSRPPRATGLRVV